MEPSSSSVSCQPNASRLARALFGTRRRRRRTIRLASTSAMPIKMIRSPNDTTWSAMASGIVSPRNSSRVSASAISRGPLSTTRSRSSASTIPASTRASARTGVAPLSATGTRLAITPTLTTAMPTRRRLRRVKTRAATRPATAIRPGCGRSNWSTAIPHATATTNSEIDAMRTPARAVRRPRRAKPTSEPMMMAKTTGAKATEGSSWSCPLTGDHGSGRSGGVCGPLPQRPLLRAVPISFSPSERST